MAFRRGCLAVGCRCFAASGAERKDVNGEKTTDSSRKQPTLSQKGAQRDQQNDSKGNQTTIKNDVEQRSETCLEQVGKSVAAPGIRRSMLGALFYTIQEMTIPKIIPH